MTKLEISRNVETTRVGRHFAFAATVNGVRYVSGAGMFAGRYPVEIANTGEMIGGRVTKSDFVDVVLDHIERQYEEGLNAQLESI